MEFLKEATSITYVSVKLPKFAQFQGAFFIEFSFVILHKLAKFHYQGVYFPIQ